MEDRLIFILNKYESELKNYKYITYDELKNIESRRKIKYISKNNLSIKNANIRRYIEPNILEIYINSKKIWSIYTNKYYIFIKKLKDEIFRNTLQSLVDSNFNIIKRN